MNRFSLAFVLSIAALGFQAPAFADEWNRLTTITFSGPVEIPGKVLAAGKYQFQLLDVPGSRDIVEIFNGDHTKIEDVLLAIPDQRMQATDKTVIQFAETPDNSPEAIKAWFYPGSHTGLEFVYPHDRAVKLAKANHEPVYATRSDLSSYSGKQMKAGDADATKMKQSDISTVQPDGSEKPYNSR